MSVLREKRFKARSPRKAVFSRESAEKIAAAREGISQRRERAAAKAARAREEARRDAEEAERRRNAGRRKTMTQIQAEAMVEKYSERQCRRLSRTMYILSFIFMAFDLLLITFVSGMVGFLCILPTFLLFKTGKGLAIAENMHKRKRLAGERTN